MPISDEELAKLQKKSELEGIVEYGDTPTERWLAAELLEARGKLAAVREVCRNVKGFHAGVDIADQVLAKIGGGR